MSVIGLVYYLLEYYETVYFYIGPTYINGYTISDRTINDVTNYITEFFKNDKLFNDQINIISNVEKLINEGVYGEYHVCNTLTGDWSEPNRTFINLPNIDKGYYFNDENPIFNKLPIPDNHKCSPNKHLPSTSIQTNHLFYYELVGLNNTVSMEFFNYVRDVSSEQTLKLLTLEKYYIINDKYNIVNDPIDMSDRIKPFILNDYPIININHLSSNPCNLITLLEGAESIHFIEGSNVNFFYHAQHKNIFKYDKLITFHIWAWNRNWPSPSMNLDYAWTMMNTPKLNNWIFKF